MDIVTEIDMVFPIGSATGKTISILYSTHCRT